MRASLDKAQTADDSARVKHDSSAAFGRRLLMPAQRNDQRLRPLQVQQQSAAAAFGHYQHAAAIGQQAEEFLRQNGMSRPRVRIPANRCR